MEFQDIFNIAANQGIICVLFVYLFYSTRQEASKREDRLVSIIDKHTEELSKITITLNKLSDDISDIKEEKTA